MRTYIAFLFGMACVGLGCGPSKKDKLEELRVLKEELNQGYTDENAQTFTRLALEFVGDFPQDSACPPLLFNSAQLFMNLNQPEASLKCIRMVESRHPDYHKLADALFLKGLVFDALTPHADSAAWAYRHFIQKFPNHPDVRKARMSLEAMELNLESFTDSLARQVGENQIAP